MKTSRKLPLSSQSTETIDHAKKELAMDADFVESIMRKEGYSQMQNGIAIGNISDSTFLKNKFSGHYHLDRFNDVPKRKQHLITGFGPTNAPTGGTLSIILRTIMFAETTGIDSTIIISNLGAFNSRNIDLPKIDYLTKRFMDFILSLGYKGKLRAHNDFHLLVASSLTSKVLTVQDFLENEEATSNLYKKLGILGKDFPTFLDANLTIADILLPAILEKKERILVSIGIEEHYFPKLANIVLKRFNDHFPGLFTHKNVDVSAIFGHLIEGLNGFPKMSKSIPESSINLGDTPITLKRKIMECSNSDERIIFQMMNLVSDWNVQKLKSVQQAFLERGTLWDHYKKEYLEYFLKIKKHWEGTKLTRKHFDVRSLFNP